MCNRKLQRGSVLQRLRCASPQKFNYCGGFCCCCRIFCSCSKMDSGVEGAAGGVGELGDVTGGAGVMLPGAFCTGFTLPAGGGFNPSTIPCAGGCVVLGAGSVSIGREFAVGSCDAVGVTLLGSPSTLFRGCGALGTALTFGTGVVAEVPAAWPGYPNGEAGPACGGGCGCAARTWSSCCCGTLGSSSESKLGAFGFGGVGPPLRGVKINSFGAFASSCRSRTLVPVPSSSVSIISAGSAGP